MQRNRQLSCLLFVLSLGVACREGQEQSRIDSIMVSAFGTDGCNGANQAFGGVALVLDDGVLIGTMSQVAASLTSEVVYLTGADGSVTALDFGADPMVPMQSTIATGGDFDLLLDGLLGGGQPAAIVSGITVLDPLNLLVTEHVSNTIAIVNLASPNPVGHFIGFPCETAGLVNGVGGFARFSLPNGTPASLAATGDGRVFIADPGNHAVREATVFGQPVVTSAGGLGVPGYNDGSLGQTLFDTPTGLSVDCGGRLLVTERGTTGNHLRALSLGTQNFFGGRSGSSSTLAGDGADATAEGVDLAASLGQPVSPVTTSEGEVYFVDATTGVLRRYSLTTGLVDCPLFADCATAVAMGGSFSGPGNYSLAITMSGNLYVLDADAGMLFLVTP